MVTTALLRRRFPALWTVCAAGLLALAAWTAGFAWFLHAVSRPIPAPPAADGIVALTGGPARVETALRLLAEHRAEKLLLSGIGGGAELAELTRLAGLKAGPLAEKVTLGREALSTRGNAAETAAWIAANHIHSLIVVTASFHMPRALLEFSRVAPDVQLYPMAVPPAAGHTAMRSLPLLAGEYTKFLLASSGIPAWLPAHDLAGHSG